MIEPTTFTSRDSYNAVLNKYVNNVLNLDVMTQAASPRNPSSTESSLLLFGVVSYSIDRKREHVGVVGGPDRASF